MANHSNNFSTKDLEGRPSGQLENSKDFATDHPAAHYPIGLHLIDCFNSNHVRLRSSFDKVKFDGKNNTFQATCHLDSWMDTRMHNSSCTWLPHFNDRNFQSGVGEIKKVAQEYTTIDVKFEHKYASAPKVVTWLCCLDLFKEGDWRVEATAEDITTDGFKLKFRVWGSTKAHWVKASWIAHPSDRSDIESGSFNTMEQRPWDKPQHNHEKKVTFTKKFERAPVVYYAISRIDQTNSSSLRARAYCKDVTPQGMTVCLESWMETVMYSMVGQWIAMAKY
ncbi:Zinc-dependent metalloprotease, partial [Rhizoctonia solani]